MGMEPLPPVYADDLVVSGRERWIVDVDDSSEPLEPGTKITSVSSFQLG